MTARDQRIDGQLAECPSREFFTRRARRWRRREPEFKIYTRVAGGKVIATRTQ